MQAQGNAVAAACTHAGKPTGLTFLTWYMHACKCDVVWHNMACHCRNDEDAMQRRLAQRSDAAAAASAAAVDDERTGLLPPPLQPDARSGASSSSGVAGHERRSSSGGGALAWGNGSGHGVWRGGGAGASKAQLLPSHDPYLEAVHDPAGAAAGGGGSSASPGAAGPALQPQPQLRGGPMDATGRSPRRPGGGGSFAPGPGSSIRNSSGSSAARGAAPASASFTID